MLAPRKKLWSTPDVAVEAAIRLLSPLSPDDVVYDIGCGDGRFLVECARQKGCRCVGIEIDEPRAAEARNKVREAGLEHLVAIRVGNALEADFSEATAIFLYLVPRGLRIMLPLLRAHPTARRVVTYMKGFKEGRWGDGEDVPELLQVEKVSPPHQPGAQWPLYLFEFGGGGTTSGAGGAARVRGGGKEDPELDHPKPNAATADDATATAAAADGRTAADPSDSKPRPPTAAADDADAADDDGASSTSSYRPVASLLLLAACAATVAVVVVRIQQQREAADSLRRRYTMPSR